jgi:Protein of unknown function (DUF664)
MTQDIVNQAVPERWSAGSAGLNEWMDGANIPDVGASVPMTDGTEAELRGLLVHMIDEYARHCGHADLLRERVDGRVGQ